MNPEGTGDSGGTGVLTWLALALGALLLVGRWVLGGRYDSLGRARAFPMVGVLVLAVPAAAVATPGVLRWREERALERAASSLVGFPVDVQCQSLGGAFVDAGAELGWVPYGADGVPERHTLIKYEPCSDLRHYLGSDESAPTAEQVIAVHVLTHEAMHMSGITVEAEAECAAVQRDARMAALLGAAPQEAAALAETYWHTVFPRMPDAYRSPECRPGGRLDEHLPDPPWADEAER
jgi:hypothetical protein